MMIHEIIPESKVPRFGVSPADYFDLDQYQGSFTDIGVYRTRTMELSGTGTPESVSVAQTSAAVFPLLGVSAADGRTFLPEEDQAEQSVVVISDGLRRRRFAASSPIGERLTLDRRPYTIVGVMPPGVRVSEARTRSSTASRQMCTCRWCSTRSSDRPAACSSTTA